MLVSFIVFLTCFALIGLSSAKFSSKSKDDYYLAGRGVSAWLTGLSAVATNNSGYMFIGVIGYTYYAGLSAIWLMVGWIAGDLIASFYIHQKVQQHAKATGAVSVMSLVSLWQGEHFQLLRRILSWTALILMTAYAAAQFIAGSKALHVLLDWPIWMGAILVAVMVAAYCFAGGIRASIWTDAAQSFVMVAAMSILLFVAVTHIGGISQVVDELQQVDGFFDLTPDGLIFDNQLGVVAFAIGWMFAGFSVVGQPHIMVRFIALDTKQNIRTMRMWYYLWFSVFYAMATCVGLLSRILLDNQATFDAELALPMMAVELLPGWLVGLILAGIFAATLSTADSLVLSCSAAFSQDCLNKPVTNTKVIKLITLSITLITLLVAMFAKQSVFTLVVFAWSALGCALAPMLIGLILGWRVNQMQALAVVFSSVAVALAWRQLDWHNQVYEGLAGILVGLAVFYFCKATGSQTKEADYA
ncbi:transporter SSS family protein [Catenovulum agarivorans DS-2]|uniref:Sodium/proline symporter n=1 Tax=Catenovulum agarivorans DS-2 TaxID=1328313 RepID=W7QEB4_9ALTE|nr:sodium/proline symporter [Catenovulum agarivorans]EWH11224.1 transporter SSS family protein [Catenovulum agarivorans DS-2]